MSSPPEELESEPRAAALQALYEADRLGLDHLPDDLPLKGKARRLAAGVLQHLQELDEAIDQASEHWRLERMPVVDRAILRLGLFELRYRPDTPTAVIIAEAVDLAKRFSTERSGAFVNGVLAALARRERGRTTDGD